MFQQRLYSSCKKDDHKIIKELNREVSKIFIKVVINKKTLTHTMKKTYTEQNILFTKCKTNKYMN